MRSTTEDLCRWHDALLGGRLLHAPSLAAMLAPVRLNDGSLATIETDADTVAAWGTLRYGMGIAMGNTGGRPLVTHTGSINGFLSQLTSYPEQRVSVAVIINSGRADEARAGANEKALRAALREGARIALG